MQSVKLQLSTPPEINNDITVELTHEGTGKVTQIHPFLDGTVKASNLAAGAYRLKVTHPNIPTTLWDDRIRIFPDRQTFIPIRIPDNLFKDTPIQDTAIVDLGPVRDKLGHSADSADDQAKKKGGQPIYADDWNTLSEIVGDVARTTSELTNRVAPNGHHHPELVDKIQEIQGNLDRLLQVFGQTLVQLERQIQSLAMQRRVDAALDQIPTNNDPAAIARVKAARDDLSKAVGDLDNYATDTPYAYTSQVRRVGERITQKLNDVLPTDHPELRSQPDVQAASNAAFAASSSLPAYTYDAELAIHQKIHRQAGKPGAAVALGGK
jgi:hypothetical protein